jgi:hypothetical protein
MAGMIFALQRKIAELEKETAELRRRYETHRHFKFYKTNEKGFVNGEDDCIRDCVNEEP